MARQKLGQHFLKSSAILEKIAVAACGKHAGLAVEIGPGRGALTEHLLAHADQVIALEVDDFLVRHLQTRWKGEKRLSVLAQDALRTDFSTFGTGVVAGNLPYYAATAMISRYLRNPGALKSGVFLIQKEVADRICAQPGSRDYGYLSVESQFLAETQYLFTVRPGAFQPPPKVDSAVVRLTPRPVEQTGFSTGEFLTFASTCFRQKRKTLRNNLSSRFSGEAIAAEPLMSQRAEQLDLADLRALWQRLTATSSGQ